MLDEVRLSRLRPHRGPACDGRSLCCIPYRRLHIRCERVRRPGPLLVEKAQSSLGVSGKELGRAQDRPGRHQRAGARRCERSDCIGPSPPALRV